MNGRVYDPELGRFLSPDPFVQFPESTQGYNRYAYVANNPLSYNDPSGHFLHIIVAAYLQAQGYQMAALMVASVGGAVQGYIQSGSAGATKGFVFGIAGGVIANGIGGKFGHEIGYSHANFIPKLLSQGIAQGALSRAGGGRFSDGFLGAAASEAAGPWLSKLPRGAVQAVAAAIIGGTASTLGGGKFANGAISAAFTNIFNQQGQQAASEKGDSETFEGRSAGYRQMQSELTQNGVDTVWFGVAADINDFFASREGLLLSAHDYVDDLGAFLYKKNVEAYQDILSGKIGQRGQALDNLLVTREQGLVQSFTASRYGDTVPGHVAAPIKGAFAFGRGAMPTAMVRGINYVETHNRQSFNYFDTWHRIELGQALMSQSRHGR